MSNGILQTLGSEKILRAVERHQSGDWGDVSESERAENDQALSARRRLISAYQTENGIKFWLVTRADRRSTQLYLTQDY